MSAVRRLSTVTVDQAIAGGSNVLILVLAARLLDTASFGLFGIAVLTYTLVTVAARALVAEPLLVHPQEARARTGEVVGTGILLGLLLAALLGLGGAAVSLVDPALAGALLVLAGCVPLLVLQDLGRYLGFATQRPGEAVRLDLAWLALQVAAVAVLSFTGTHELTWFMAAWAGSGAVAGLLVLRRVRPSELRFGSAWLRTTWDFSWRYLLAVGSAQGAALLGAVAVSAIAGADALGAVLGAALLVRPFMTLQIAAVSAGISEVANGTPDLPAVRRHARHTSAITTVAAGLNAAVILLLPDAVGRQVLGATWEVALPLLLPTAVQVVLLGTITGPRSALAGLRAVRTTTVVDVAGSLALLVLTVLGALVDGARGATWAVAAGQLLVAVAWWSALRRRRDAGAVPTTPTVRVTVPTTTKGASA